MGGRGFRVIAVRIRPPMIRGLFGEGYGGLKALESSLTTSPLLRMGMCPCFRDRSQRSPARSPGVQFTAIQRFLARKNFWLQSMGCSARWRGVQRDVIESWRNRVQDAGVLLPCGNQAKSSRTAAETMAGRSRGMKWPTPSITRRARRVGSAAFSAGDGSSEGRPMPSSAP